MNVGHASRRVVEAVRAFDNGWAILARIGTRRPGDLEFRQRGTVITCPNVPGARVPVFEVFAEDAYRSDWLSAGLTNPKVLDIGGHIGCFTVDICRVVPGATVHAYEASPTTAAYLAHNVATNVPDGRATVFNEALSSANGTLTLIDNGGSSGLNSIHGSTTGGTSVEVPAVSFHTALERLGGNVDIVKMDIEGAEYGVLAGSDPSEWRSVQRVVMEYHDVDGHGFLEVEKFFTAAGMSVVRHEPSTDRLGVVWFSREQLN
jgi:FkbM family methyltransferase